MTEQPAVSVIVLGWNGRQYVDPCLTSLLAQDFDRPYEILFVDNGSTDGTADLAERHAGVRVHRLDRNYGYCLGNNKGFELAEADVVVFLNQDVVVHRRWLRELTAAVESDPAIKAGHANIIQSWYPEYAAKELEAPVDAAYTAELSPLGFVEYRQVPVAQRVVDTLFLHGVSIILKRDVVDEIGGYVFDPDMFAYAEDMDLALRIRNAGYRTVVATGAVLYHDHTLQDQVSLRSFVKTVRIIRNRLLALWKCSSWPEFLALAAVTLAGAPLNSSQFGLPLSKKLLYFLLLIPPTAAAALATVAAMPQFAGRRRQTLAARRLPRGWLLRTLLFDRASLSRPAPVATHA
ncbi:MAG TPA: glycosyltransferase family 2 protein [Dehalococcoidia bacterium]